MDATWRIFTAAILAGMAAAAVMLLARDPDTGNKPGGEDNRPWGGRSDGNHRFQRQQ
jgi:Spy/CpxP family protein refolding chaperone